jgi:hypothetical protein
LAHDLCQKPVPTFRGHALDFFQTTTLPDGIAGVINRRPAMSDAGAIRQKHY